MANVEYAKEGDRSMRAAVFTAYDADLNVVDNIAVPSDLGEKDVLVAVKSSSVNPIDWKIRRGDLKLMTGKHFPKTAGRDLSGIIEQKGSQVTRFEVGDEVYGMPEPKYGTYAQYVKCSEDALAKKPKNMSWNEAASVPLTALTAHDCLYKYGNLSAGQNVLILGGGSGVGLFGIQLARITGAKVWTTASQEKKDLCVSMGADHVIDYKNEDLVKAIGDVKMDLIFDAVGHAETRNRSFDVVKAHGIVVTTTPNDHSKPLNATEALSTIADVLWKKVSNYISSGVSYKPMVVADLQGKTLDELTQHIEAGRLKTVIDSVHSLDEISRASAKSEEGKTNGKIVVEVSK
eukprot:TRINITY_DN21981_c0_g1_i1.p1 TRINITY_DN21981_c0_g1~~TRINITY_DN21981_c0_g1_i1.p1  ORF type:complete len:347 (+),score=90.27 TRINITY_DN21981_c0_g1_i1:80-1120(+)